MRLTKRLPTMSQAGCAETTGQIGLVTFAAFAWLGTAGANMGILLMLLGLILQAVSGGTGRSWKSPLLVWALAWTAFIAAWAIIGPMHTSLDATEFSNAVSGYANLALVVPVAWWGAHFQRKRSLMWVLAAGFAGFVIGRLLEINWADPLEFYHRRDGLGLPAIPFGQYSAVALLGLLLCTPPTPQSVRRDWRATALWVLWTAGILALAFALVASRSRGVWLAFSITAIPAIGVKLYLSIRHLSTRVYSVAAVAAVLLSLLSFVLIKTGAGDMLMDRIAKESSTYQTIMTGEFGEVGDGSVGSRIQMYRIGLDYWLERPWFGWGPGTGPAMLDTRGSAHIARFEHLHSLYVQLLAEIGLIGTLLFALPLAMAASQLVARSTGHPGPPHMRLFLGAALTLHLIAGITNFRVFTVDWRFFWLLFVGLALVGYFRQPCTPARPVSGSTA